VSAVPANILLRAFPGNPNYYYNSEGLPTAPDLPASVRAAVEAITFNSQLNNIKSDFGISPDIYGHAYALLPGQTDSLGNPSPYQVSAAIHNNPFTAANSSVFAAQNQQTTGTLNVNWQGQTPGGDSMIADFPSAYTMLATFDAITAAVLAPGYYQQLARSVEDFAYDLNVFGVHYPIDVIGGRILGTYVLAQTLSRTPL
jgi:subtilase-type serine protease